VCSSDLARRDHVHAHPITVTNFTKVLSGTDDTVQEALDTLDDHHENDDIAIGGDAHGLWSRAVNGGLNPTEHWKAGADQLAWTGWATYTGFVTPSSVSHSKSCKHVDHSSAPIRAFYYRPYINAQTQIYCRAFAQGQTAIGIMVDDGVDNVDGLGANNFVRIFLERAADTGLLNISEEHRAGGGGVTKNALFAGISPLVPYGLQISYGIGTRWSSWSAYFQIVAEFAAYFVSAVGSLAWTPARHGLYYYTSTATRQSSWDWFHEA
jgi:hypothetical protein